MLPIPNPEDYDVSSQNGFLSAHPPLESLPDAYYEPWEYVVKNLQGLILSKRLREVVDRMQVLSTKHLKTEPEWRRAYSMLGFMTHAYVWGGDKPAEWVPPTISIPFTTVCDRLELPMVATYAGLCLWNWKPIFDSESYDTLANLDMIDTFTGSLDEKWFYLISVAIEARGAPMVPLMLSAIQAARNGNRYVVASSLRDFAERLDQLGAMLTRMADNCDPHVFYHRIRPYLAGSKNMKDAGLPHGIVFDNGGPMNKQRYVQFSGGSNAQSSLLQFFDAVLSIEHRPTGMLKSTSDEHKRKGLAPPTSFIHEMRQYMPGPHARFLQAVSDVANIREFVQCNRQDKGLTLAFDACLAMLSSFRDVHLQLVSRYIIIKSQQAKNAEANPPGKTKKINLAMRPKSNRDAGETEEQKKAALRGTGGTSLMPFLRQARDETGEPAVDEWTQKFLGKSNGIKAAEATSRRTSIQGLAAVWRVDNSDGGLCLV